MHGYGIAQRIEQMAGDMLRVEEGTLYPALYRIEQRGWIAGKWGLSDNNRRARFYALTRAGRKRLTAEQSHWKYLSLAIQKVLEAT
jgi:transcriptional regulator